MVHSLETKIKIGNANRGIKNGFYKHGMSKTPFHHHWRIMKSRCVDRNKRYFGRIKISKQWISFLNFKKDMYRSFLVHVKKYGYKKTTLDRKNNNFGYSRKNCRWATPEQQSNNRNITRKFTVNGKKMTIREMSYLYNKSYDILWNRIVKYNWPIKKAITLKLWQHHGTR